MSDQRRVDRPDHVSRPWRIGLSANLSRGHSVHRRTFLNAVEMALQSIAGAGHAIELHYVCDGACAEQATHAAQALSEWGADVVVGHYASAAAAAANPIYRKHGIPLLLPAATADVLTEPGGIIFRICDPDRALAHALVHNLQQQHAVRVLAVQHDVSVHGAALGADITAAACAIGLEVVEPEEAADAVVFVGLFPNSVTFLRARAACPRPRLLVLTDDAVSPELAQALPDFAREVVLYGARPPTTFPHATDVVAAHIQHYGYEPGVYFLETYAALEIVQQYLDGDARRRISLMRGLAERPWQTVMGPIRFLDHEGGAYRYGRWRFAAGRLNYEGPLTVPAHDPAKASVRTPH